MVKCALVCGAGGFIGVHCHPRHPSVPVSKDFAHRQSNDCVPNPYYIVINDHRGGALIRDGR